MIQQQLPSMTFLSAIKCNPIQVALQQSLFPFILILAYNFSKINSITFVYYTKIFNIWELSPPFYMVYLVTWFTLFACSPVLHVLLSLFVSSYFGCLLYELYSLYKLSTMKKTTPSRRTERLQYLVFAKKHQFFSAKGRTGCYACN